MAETDLPSIAYLRQRLRYEPETGKLYWREHEDMPQRWNTRYAGREAFTAVRNTGYKHGRVLGVAYQAHRVIWALVHGVWPDGQIDHIDHDPVNNRIENLRIVQHRENQRNASLRGNNTSGTMGVSWYKAGSKWTAYITVDCVKQHLGYFNTFEDAVTARKQAERIFGFHENHGIGQTKGTTEAPT